MLSVMAVVFVFVMLMLMCMIVDDDDGMCGRDATTKHRLEGERVVGEAEARHNLGNLDGVGPRIDKRAERHVARRASEAMEPCSRDGLCHYFTILAIAHAAPKPLSMPTTVMPLAHDACIARSAVTPLRLEP